MSTKFFLIGLAFLLGLSIGISLPIGTETNISLIANSITAVTGLATIWLGFIIYRDVGYSKKISEKQFETVAEFLEELKGTIIQITGLNNNLMYQSSPSMGNPDKYLDQWLDFTVSIDNENFFFGGFEKLFKLRNSIYMPTELKDKLTLISGLTFTSGEPEERTKCVKITINKPTPISVPFNMLENGQPIKLGGYLKRIQQTLIESSLWIEKHSGGKINV